jgi:hypothetical protein
MNIFNQAKHWRFTEADALAEAKLSELQEQTRKELPESFYSSSLPLTQHACSSTLTQ